MTSWTHELREMAERIRPFIHRTPILRSSRIDEICGAELFFKCENFQRTGSFKMRGASNAVMSLDTSSASRGVVAHSSGNFAQAVAKAASLRDITARIVMPENAPIVKRTATAGYGAEIRFSKSTAKARQAMADQWVEETGGSFLHPSDQWEVIVGQGSCAMEVFEEVDALDYIVAPVGGGGLIAGTAMAAQSFSSTTKVIGVEPHAADDAYRSLQSGQIEYNETTDTIADGLRTHLGEMNFPIINEHVESIIRVEEEEIIRAMHLIWQTMKIIIEPSCAVPLAGILKEKERFQGRRLALILTGGNVELESVSSLFSRV